VAARRSRVPKRAALGFLAAVLVIGGCRGKGSLPVDAGEDRTLAAGRAIFERKCASCHGLNGDGKTVTAGRFPYANLIDGKWRGDGSLGSIEDQIRRGRDPMPKFQGKLTDEEIRDTARYVQELAKRGEGRK
jgi:mono/diheme cytochrome c family protein